MIDIIPAIDIIDGKCVRLTQGDYNRSVVYNTDPLEVAKEFEANGIRRLHMVDLDGAKSAHIVNFRILERIASRTSLIIDFGGGIKSDADIAIAFENGAQMVTVGSIAANQPQLFESWITRFGNQKIILGADIKDEHIATHGWLKKSSQKLLPYLKNYAEKGVTKVLCTDISRDGMLQGPSIEIYKKILSEIPNIYLIASGGISSIADIRALNDANVPAVVIGKALYEQKITLGQLTRLIIELNQTENNN